MRDHQTHLLVPPAHETQDVTTRFIAVLLAGIGVTLMALAGLAYFMFPGEVQDRRFATPLPAFPTPALQPDPAADMRHFHAQEMQRLNSAGWIDRSQGVVHIPINQAMRDIAGRGIPGWPAGGAAP